MTPCRGECCSPPFLPASPLSSSQTLEGLFELTQRPSRALDSPPALLTELQRNKDTVRCVTLGVEVPGQLQEQLSKTLIVCLLKTCFFIFLHNRVGAWASLAPLRPPPHLTHTKGRVKESLSVVLKVVQNSHHIDALFLVCFRHLLPHLI